MSAKMKIINTSAELLSSYEAGSFDKEKWEAYIDKAVPGAKDLCKNDMQDCLNAGFSWEEDFLPVLNAVIHNEEKRYKVIKAFCDVTDGLDERIIQTFGRTVEVNIILYLGLCNGAGWVTEIDGTTTVLLGIEKIMELGWYDKAKMVGLIVHELGHAYHKQYGIWNTKGYSLTDQFLWQLFTEGIAMVFEQEIVGDPGFYQQDTDGWKQWCTENAGHIRISFSKDIYTMTHEDQRYFGDWVSFEGHADTGYYLGTRFVRYLLSQDRFDDLIKYDIDRVRKCFDCFLYVDL